MLQEMMRCGLQTVPAIPLPMSFRDSTHQDKKTGVLSMYVCKSNTWQSFATRPPKPHQDSTSSTSTCHTIRTWASMSTTMGITGLTSQTTSSRAARLRLCMRIQLPLDWRHVQAPRLGVVRVALHTSDSLTTPRPRLHSLRIQSAPPLAAANARPPRKLGRLPRPLSDRRGVLTHRRPCLQSRRVLQRVLLLEAAIARRPSRRGVPTHLRPCRRIPLSLQPSLQPDLPHVAAAGNLCRVCIHPRPWLPMIRSFRLVLPRKADAGSPFPICFHPHRWLPRICFHPRPRLRMTTSLRCLGMMTTCLRLGLSRAADGGNLFPVHIHRRPCLRTIPRFRLGLHHGALVGILFSVRIHPHPCLRFLPSLQRGLPHEVGAGSPYPACIHPLQRPRTCSRPQPGLPRDLVMVNHLAAHNLVMAGHPADHTLQPAATADPPRSLPAPRAPSPQTGMLSAQGTRLAPSAASAS